MVDKVFPLKMETGVENDYYPTEIDATEDGIPVKELLVVADETDPKNQTIQQGVRTDAQNNLVLFDRHCGERPLAELLGSDLKIRAGRALTGDFSGTPKKAVVTFSTPFADNNYSVSLVGQSDSRSWLAEDLTTDGFTINSQANAAIVGSVLWTAEHNS
jgi:hypothetical protein